MRKNAEQFLSIAGEFKLGKLITESSHPVTRELSQTANNSIPDALGLLFKVDEDVVSTYCRWVESDAPVRISQVVIDALRSGGKVFFTGCGATGRLSIQLNAIWRDFWQKSGHDDRLIWEDRAQSVMAGGDYALIKSVEGFEDFTQFGAAQINDLGVTAGDVVFAITEGGETSFVIGTAWQGVRKGAKVYFVYNNPDDLLREHVTRSREVIDAPHIEKINLTTGPMSIMGSTRMQATSIQLCVMLTILEMVVHDLSGNGDSTLVPEQFLAALLQVHSTLSSQPIRDQLAELVFLEKNVYSAGRKSSYFADSLGIDVLTDTTERSPTFSIPAFRKWDDVSASESWAYLFLPYRDSNSAWHGLLKRPPYGLSWTDDRIRAMVPPESADRQCEIMKQIGVGEILRFKIGLDGLQHRPWNPGDMAVSVVTEREKDALLSPDSFYRTQIEHAHKSGAFTALIYIGSSDSIDEIKKFIGGWDVPCKTVFLPVSDGSFLLDAPIHIGIKMLLNAHSTCTMVRLGRVIGNCMVAVVPSNLKLIDRSIRYIQTLTGLSYEDACYRLFESIEYVKPRMQSGQAYPPVVKLTVLSIRDNITLAEAEVSISSESPDHR
ncbi:MAG: hypothetical protein ACYC27_11190 [Armatimonadota bacterium]